MSSVAVKGTLSNIKAKDLTLEVKVKDVMYGAKSKTLQNLYLCHIASNRYKIAQKAMSVSLSSQICLLHLRYTESESTLSPKHARCGAQYPFPMTENSLNGC